MWHTPRFRRRSAIFRLERLEDRTVLSTFLVSNLADSGPDSLRRAILDANANSGADVITFAPGLHGTITLTSGELQITNDLDIEGPGANKLTISGNDSSRVFDIIDINPSNPQTTVTIAGLTIADGLADKDAPVYASAGSGILNQGDLTLNNVVVSDNQAVGDASVTADVAGYYVTGAGYGGGVANFGMLEVAGSTFTANQALGGDGSKGPNVMFEGGLSTFPGVGIGGGLYNAAGSKATVSDSRFDDNLAQGGSNCFGTFAGLGQAGAIYNAASLTITGSSFRDNQAVGGDRNVSDLYSGDSVGGGISSGNHTLLAGHGGTDAVLKVSQSTFSHNQAVGGDDNTLLPGVPPDPSYGPGNGSGGGVFVFQGSATILQTTLDSNQARGGAGGGDQDGSIGSGGGIAIVNFIGGVTATIKDSAIVHNEAIGGPGSSGGRGGGMYNEANDATISDSVLSNNQAVTGGGIYNSGTLKLDHDVLSENQAVGDKNSSPVGDLGGVLGGALGGAVMTFGPLDVTACQFLNNQALGASGTPGQLLALSPPAPPWAARSISVVSPPPPPRSTSTVVCSSATWPGAATTATASAWLVWVKAVPSGTVASSLSSTARSATTRPSAAITIPAAGSSAWASVELSRMAAPVRRRCC